MSIIGFDHLQLAVPPGRENEARAFYGQILGLTEISKPEPLAARGGCWFSGPGIQIHLGVERDFRPARKAHPAFLVSNLAAWRKSLVAAGVETVDDDHSLENVHRFYAFDPFGNRIEFIQAGEGFSE